MFASPVPRRRAPHTGRARLRVDRLEGRDVPAGDPLATFAGTVDAAHQPGWVQMEVQTPGPVLLTFETDPAAGSAFRPGRLRVFEGEGPHARAVGTAGGHGFALAAVDGGIHFARVTGAAGTTGAFDVVVTLAGDVTGDHQVDAQDLDTIRSLRGVRVGQNGYLPAADVNHNGVIGAGDLQLAARNVGRTATVGDITADQFLFASGGPRFAQFNPKTMNGISLVINGINDEQTPIAADGFSWGVTNTGGRVSAADLQVVAPTSAASPLLFKAVATGRSFADATLFAGRVGTKPKLEWDMSDVLVSSYAIGGSGGHGVSLEDSFSLNFTKLTVKYTPTLPTGRPGTTVSASFDFATGQAG